MKMGYKISLLVIGILLAISTTIGSSYALWVIEDSQEGTNKILTGCFSLSYSDKLNDESTSINLTNAYPLTDAEGLKLKPYTVVLKNTCSIAANYELILTTDLANTLSEVFLKTNFKDVTNNIDYSSKLMNELSTTTLDENMAKQIIEKNQIQIGKTYSLVSGILEPNEEVKYELRIWLDESANKDTMEKTFTGVVSNTAYATESTN